MAVCTAVAVAVLAGCGGSHAPAVRSLQSTGHPSTMATGSHDHVGEFCSGRDQARYAGERLVCVTGRLAER